MHKIRRKRGYKWEFLLGYEVFQKCKWEEYRGALRETVLWVRIVLYFVIDMDCIL